MALGGCQTIQITNRLYCAPISPDSARNYSFVNTRWKLFNAEDEQGLFWNNSSLVFSSQQSEKNRTILTGYFEWRANGTYLGREDFSGYFLADNGAIVLEGKHIENRKIMTSATYQAVLCRDRKTLSRGKWSSPSSIPGKWSASLVEIKKQIDQDAPKKLFLL